MSVSALMARREARHTRVHCTRGCVMCVCERIVDISLIRRRFFVASPERVVKVFRRSSRLSERSGAHTVSRSAKTLINTCRVVVGFSRGVASGATTTETRKGTIVVVCRGRSRRYFWQGCVWGFLRDI